MKILNFVLVICLYVLYCFLLEFCCFMDKCMEVSKWVKFFVCIGEKVLIFRGNDKNDYVLLYIN